jgi:hypothetical protein
MGVRSEVKKDGMLSRVCKNNGIYTTESTVQLMFCVMSQTFSQLLAVKITKIHLLSKSTQKIDNIPLYLILIHITLFS